MTETKQNSPGKTPRGEHPQALALKKSRKWAGRASFAAQFLLTCFLLKYDAMSCARGAMARFQDVGALTPWLRGFYFSAGLALLYGAVGFPFSFWQGYLIEKKFGLATQSAKDWLLDAVKATLVGVVLGTFILSGLLACLFWGQQNWWWWAALGSAFFSIALTRLAPQFIVPLFFKLEPLDDLELNESLKKIGLATKTPILGIYKIDLSRRTKKANAAVMGFGATRKAVVGDTLLQDFERDEVEFVLAHELGHHRYHDLWTGNALAAFLGFIGFYCTNEAVTSVGSLMAVPFPPDISDFHPVVLFWIAIVLSVVSSLTAPLAKLHSRFIEARADRFALASTKNTDAGIRAFERLGHQNRAVFHPPLWEELLFHTHPSIAKRVERLKASR